MPFRSPVQGFVISWRASPRRPFSIGACAPTVARANGKAARLVSSLVMPRSLAEPVRVRIPCVSRRRVVLGQYLSADFLGNKLNRCHLAVTLAAPCTAGAALVRLEGGHLVRYGP